MSEDKKIPIENIQFVTGSFAPERKATVNEFCKAIDEYINAVDKEHGESEDWPSKQLHALVQDYRQHQITIRKSNFLYRLLYLGERVRLEKCPTHKGKWSGYGWGRQCACQDYEAGGYGPDITGWLPRKD